MTLEGAALATDIDYRADVKPVSRAHFASDLLWHSTLDSTAAVTSPDVGSPGAVNGGAGFTAGRYGNGASITSPSSNVSFPAPGNLRVDRGAVELWYLPSYYYVDGTAHRIWSYVVDAVEPVPPDERGREQQPGVRDPAGRCLDEGLRHPGELRLARLRVGAPPSHMGRVGAGRRSGPPLREPGRAASYQPDQRVQRRVDAGNGNGFHRRKRRARNQRCPRRVPRLRISRVDD